MTREDEYKKKTALRLILKTIIYAFAVFGLLFILILIGVLGIMSPGKIITPVPEKTVLRINFDTNYMEVRGDDFFAEFADIPVYSFFDLIRAINTAADDDRVKAIAATVNMSPLGLAQIQDIAESVKYFRSKGKEAYIFSSGMGAFGGGTKEYYLASVFDEIWLQPISDIGMTGVHIEVPFFKGILHKVGVDPEFYARNEYKTAAESLISSGFTPAYKEEMSKLGGGLFHQLAAGISQNRGLELKDVKKLIDQAPVFSSKAIEYKLADNLGYRQDMEGFLAAKYGAEILDISDYMSNIGDYQGEDLPHIAFLVLEGAVQSGQSSNNPMYDAVIGADTVQKQLEELSRRRNLRAVILRVNSPGGSYAASDEIMHALDRFKEKTGVPIVVSMGNYAASGGYFIALAGNYIVAEPATLTGSIGVLGGKMVLERLWKKLHINWGEMNFGKNAGILSVNHKFSPEEKKLFNRSLDMVYKDFLIKVTAVRKIENVDDVAGGRVWLGEGALKAGLVDELGGIETALKKAKELGGIIPGADFGLVYYPRRQSFQEKLTEFLENGGGLPAVKLPGNFGIDAEDLKLLQRLQYDAVLPPFKLEM